MPPGTRGGGPRAASGSLRAAVCRARYDRGASDARAARDQVLVVAARRVMGPRPRAPTLMGGPDATVPNDPRTRPGHRAHPRRGPRRARPRPPARRSAAPPKSRRPAALPQRAQHQRRPGGAAMSTIEIYGDRVTDRQGRALAVGTSRVASMGPADPAAIARHTRDVLLTRVNAGDDWPRVRVILRAHAPAALELFHRVALESFARRPPDGGCRWCVCLALGAVTGEPPHDDRHAALLGAACANCRKRQSIATARAKARLEARAEKAGLTAAAAPPAAPSRQRPRPPQRSVAVPFVSATAPTDIWTGCGWVPAGTVPLARAEPERCGLCDRRSIAAAKAAGTYRSRASRRQG